MNYAFTSIIKSLLRELLLQIFFLLHGVCFGMNIGISTACFYPMPTEDAVQILADLDVDRIELFLNSHDEFSDEFIESLLSITEKNNIKICAVHPYTSGYEHFLFSPEYIRRVDESLLYYEYLFKAAKKLRASYFSFHGAEKPSIYKCFDKYCEIIKRLTDTAYKHDIIFCQENVSNKMSSSPEFMGMLISQLGEGNIFFTLDLKQANRAGVAPDKMLEVMGKGLRHIHINDFDENHDCLIPGAGNYDLKKFIDKLKQKEYDGNLIIEVYRHNYDDYNKLSKAKKILENL